MHEAGRPFGQEPNVFSRGSCALEKVKGKALAMDKSESNNSMRWSGEVGISGSYMC